MAFSYQFTKDNSGIIVSDPIYGEFEVGYPYSKIILTKEMQRLEDISQNGFSEYDYPGLVNNERLSHSVGAFYNMQRIIEHLEKKLSNYEITISQTDKDIALCSMLLHDIGHGPMSHSFEKITHYSHEKRTAEILLGDTEIHSVLEEIFGEQKVKQIASFIAEINDETIPKDSFTKLLKSLVSHQLDADRLDYLQRDSYYAGIPTAINTENVIKALELIVNEDQEYELAVNQKGLTSIETILLERFQKYRDIYFTDSSVILDTAIFKKALEYYRKNPNVVTGEVPIQFKKIVETPENIDLQEFLDMTESNIMKGFSVLKETSIDPLLSYLSDPNNVKDYLLFETEKSEEEIKQYLIEIFNNPSLENTDSIFSTSCKIRLYKKDEGLKIIGKNKIVDLSEATNLIRPQESLEKKALVFNPELLRLELGLSRDEFQQYEGEIEMIIQELNKKPEEFELKYILPESEKSIITIDKIIDIFQQNGFKKISESEKENNDKYFDDKNASLLSRGGSLRIRKATQDGKIKYKATYKNPTGEGSVYSSREEIEKKLNVPTLEELKKVMQQKQIKVDLDGILSTPILNSKTQRHDVVLEKNGVRVCLSFDNTTYKNYAYPKINATDSMIEIEAIGEVTDRVILNEIHNFLHAEIPSLVPNRQSKYERGVKKTRAQAKSAQKLTEPYTDDQEK